MTTAPAPYRSIFRPDLFAHRTIIVTGAGSGIGRCIAHELASLGATVALFGRRAEKLQNVADEISRLQGSADIYPCDIRDETQVRTNVAKVKQVRGRIDGLVNNAGEQFRVALASITSEGFTSILQTNLVGGFLMAREVFVHSMREQGGAVVNIVADFWRGMPGMGHSGAARAGMVNFTQTAALEWASAGVRVNAVAPGLVTSNPVANDDGPLGQMMRKLLEGIPLKRFATPSEVSAAVCFLLSDAAAFITGSTLRVDGGSPLSSPLWSIPTHDRSTPFSGFASEPADES